MSVMFVPVVPFLARLGDQTRPQTFDAFAESAYFKANVKQVLIHDGARI